MGIASLVSRVVAFLRAGYPAAMPATGYAPLAALLPRRLADDELAAITSEFASQAVRRISTVDVGVAIFRITNAMPSLDDIKRVQRRLEAIGAQR